MPTTVKNRALLFVSTCLAFALTLALGGLPRAFAADEPGDPARGRAIFVGERPLTNGGPPCISCHQIRDVGMPQGGLRAPELTHIGDLDRPLVMAALSKQRFMMMDAAFAARPLTDQERRDMAAFLADVATRNVETGDGMPAVPLLGIAAGIGVPLGVLGAVRRWRRRRHAAA